MDENTQAMLYPIGIQNFEDIRERCYVYVDKTELIHNIVNTGGYLRRVTNGLSWCAGSWKTSKRAMPRA